MVFEIDRSCIFGGVLQVMRSLSYARKGLILSLFDDDARQAKIPLMEAPSLSEKPLLSLYIYTTQIMQSEEKTFQ